MELTTGTVGELLPVASPTTNGLVDKNHSISSTVAIGKGEGVLITGPVQGPACLCIAHEYGGRNCIYMTSLALSNITGHVQKIKYLGELVGRIEFYVCNGSSIYGRSVLLKAVNGGDAITVRPLLVVSGNGFSVKKLTSTEVDNLTADTTNTKLITPTVW